MAAVKGAAPTAATTTEERKKIEAIEAIMSGADDFILWFTGEQGAYCFMADTSWLSWKDIQKCYRPSLLFSQAADLERLFGGFSDGQYAVRGTVEELRKVVRAVEDLAEKEEAAKKARKILQGGHRALFDPVGDRRLNSTSPPAGVPSREARDSGPELCCQQRELSA